MGYWPDGLVVTGVLANIAEEVELAGIKRPARLVGGGEVVKLREKLSHIAKPSWIQNSSPMWDFNSSNKSCGIIVEDLN